MKAEFIELFFVISTGTENCNARTNTMRVFPQEVHHYHHHYLPTIPSPGCPPSPNSYSAGSQYPSQNSGDSMQQLIGQMRQVMIALENMKLKVSTLSEVVDELINSNTATNAKLLLTGAKIDATTNLFELVRHVILDKLELKDLKNDIYSATRTKNGIVFDVASGLDKRRILARARERLRDDEDLRITDYFDPEKVDGASEPVIDVRFGDD